MKFDIYDFTVLTSSIHKSLSSVMGETAVMITEMIIVGIVFLTLFALLGLVLVYAERKVCAFFQPSKQCLVSPLIPCLIISNNS